MGLLVFASYVAILKRDVQKSTGLYLSLIAQTLGVALVNHDGWAVVFDAGTHVATFRRTTS
jgi:hypothetical protein